MSTPRIAPQRFFAQTMLLCILLVVPFISFGGNPAFRMDLARRTLFLAGSAIRVDQFYLVLFALLVLVAAFLLLTVVLGRVWCGWLCPQTILNDLAEKCDAQVRSLLPRSMEWVSLHLIGMIISVVMAIAMLNWFIAPAEVIRNLTELRLHPILFGFFLTLAITLYLDIILVKRGFCKNYCPYGRFQVALQDRGTLNLTFCKESRNDCIRCSSCVRVCPMGIDIRNGFQIECINCGRCIDACRTIMERRSKPAGLIAYRFGTAAGIRFGFGSKAKILSVLLLIITTAFFWGVTNRSENAFVLQRTAAVESKVLADDTRVQSWCATIGNRGQSAALYNLEIAAASETGTTLIGPVRGIRITPNENRIISFFIRYPASLPAGKTIEIRLLRDGAIVAKSMVKF